MKLLIDTNIIIGLEDAGETQERFANLHRKCQQYAVGVFVHEASKEDIGHDRDAKRKATTFSKIAKFQILEGVASPDEKGLAGKYGTLKKANDFVDAKLLNATEINAVDLLVTEDDGLHRRAKKAGLSDRVLTVADALGWIKATYEPEEVFLPAVQAVKAYGVNFNDPIFDELRKDYPAFDAWTAKCIEKHRDCWVIKDGSALAGIVIRNDENHAEAGTATPSDKILKVCTFKVADAHRGQKLGEQLLKQVLWYAQRNKYDLVYLKAYPKQTTLIRLLEEYGFSQRPKLKNDELVLEKPIRYRVLKPQAGESAIEAARRAYPRFMDGNSIRKFVVPILPSYHAKLFPEVTNLLQCTVSEATGKPGNTIRKVYICRAPTTQIQPGDLLFFYMTKSGMYASQSLTTIGVVESVRLTGDLKEVQRWTAKRSVFSDAELNDWVIGNGPLKVIDFLLIGHLGPTLSLDMMISNGIMSSWPQSITKMPDTAYRKLKPHLNLGFKF